ncbi:MAG: HlyD family type I secretion periplasmic adaptor subunit [Gammaproteobacteria bacterium]|nr:HlyD family type I secretion periplasmic adaptor subunit [Gammaproteobacteria bacterium]
MKLLTSSQTPDSVALPEIGAIDRSLRRYLLFGATVLCLLGGGAIVWASIAEIGGAVIAPATIVVDTNAKTVQHLEGGIVAELNVRDGMRVETGDVLLRLQDTETVATINTLAGQIRELSIEKARLEAERDERDAVDLPDDLSAEADLPAVQNVLDGQRRLFVSRREAMAWQKAQLEARIEQVGEQIAGTKFQLKAKGDQLAVATGEREDFAPLWAKGLVTRIRMSALDREIAELKGAQGQLRAEIARLQGSIVETRLQITQIDEERRSAVLAQHREVRDRLSTLREQYTSAAARQGRLSVLAPRAGTVHASVVHTVGGVVAPGLALMMIVPEDDALVLRAQIRPQDIDQIQVGQEATVRFTAFEGRTTPELIGEVLRVGADLSADPTTNQPFFEVRVGIAGDQMAKLGNRQLRPGLPAEVFIATGLRTAASYFLQPLTDQLAHAMRE